MSRTSSRFRGRSAGFTLIELMIVIAIIGILSGLMAGVIGYVQDTARRNECLNNLRQWGGAMSLYLDEHRSRTFPTYGDPANPSTTDPTAWYNALPPYLEEGANTAPYKDREKIPHPGDGAKSAFLCPSDTRTEWTAAELEHYYSSYSMNAWVNSGDNQKPRSERLRDSQLKFPSVFVVMAESCDGRKGGVCPGEGGNLHETPDVTAFRHNKNVNLLFADGHAATFAQDVIWEEGMEKGKNKGGVQWNPNKDLSEPENKDI